MKKIFLFALACCLVVAAHAQELPYSKYLKFSKKEYKANGFKYDEDTNTWAMRRVNGWNTTPNVLAVLVDAEEEAATYTLQNIFSKSTYSGFSSDWTPPTKLSIQ